MNKKDREEFKKQIEILSLDINEVDDIIFDISDDKKDTIINFVAEGLSFKAKPDKFVFYYISANLVKVDGMKNIHGNSDYIKQSKLLFEMKNFISNLEANLNLFWQDNDSCKIYSFDKFHRQLDSVISRCKLEFEIELLSSQTATNNSVQITNESMLVFNSKIETFNKFTRWILITSVIATSFSAWADGCNIIKDNQKSIQQETISNQSKQIKELNEQFQKLKLQIEKSK